MLHEEWINLCYQFLPCGSNCSNTTDNCFRVRCDFISLYIADIHVRKPPSNTGTVPVQYRYSTRTLPPTPPYSFILAACIKIEIRRYYQEVPAYCSRRQWIYESYRLSVIRRFLNFGITRTDAHIHIHILSVSDVIKGDFEILLW